MSYATQNLIATNQALRDRASQAFAEDTPGVGGPDPDRWVWDMRRDLAAAPGWAAAWESALVSHEGDDEYDPGADEGVITDGMILSQIQHMRGTP